MTDIVEQLESFSKRHYHETRIKMALEAKREIEECRAEVAKWKTAYQAAIEVGGEIEEQFKRMREALKKIAEGATGQLDRDSELAAIAREALEANT